MPLSESQQRGFTLVEVVVASLILSLIMLATVTALRTFGRTYDRLLVATERTSEMREVTRFLRLALRDANPDTDTFAGEASSLWWATPLDRVGSAGGIQYLRLEQRGDALMLSFAPFDPARISQADPQWGAVVEDYVLVDGVNDVAFTYLESPLGDWVDDFDGASNATLPAAVTVRVRADGEAWPPITVPLPGSGAR